MPEPIAGENLRFQVENLGRIAHADVEIRPLTLFVGENNSGKSYLATAVWAMVTGAGMQFRAPGDPAWEAALVEAERIVGALAAMSPMDEGDIAGTMQWAEDMFDGGRPSGSLTSDAPWGKWSAARLDMDLSAAIERSLPGLSPNSVVRRIRHGTPNTARVTFGRLENGSLVVAGESEVTVAYGGVGPAQTAAFALSYVANNHLGHHLASSGMRFLPASRTGYVQLAGAVTDQIMRPTNSGEASTLSTIPLPTREFLRFLVRRQLSRAGSGDTRNQDLLTLLQDRVLAGRFLNEPRADGTTELRYAPNGASVTVPIPLTSSLVTELMPFALALTEPTGMLIYEEPEAHLHPRLQRVLAQILVRLVRRGTKVLITTHSDTFVQQINNFLKRGALGEDAPVHPDYGPEDMLHEDDVAAYEFQFRPDGLTEVIRAEVQEEGLILPTFNRELISLTEETVELNERLEARRRS